MDCGKNVENYAWFSNDNNCGEIVRIKIYNFKEYIQITLAF